MKRSIYLFFGSQQSLRNHHHEPVFDIFIIFLISSSVKEYFSFCMDLLVIFLFFLFLVAIFRCTITTENLPTAAFLQLPLFSFVFKSKSIFFSTTQLITAASPLKSGCFLPLTYINYIINL